MITFSQYSDDPTVISHSESIGDGVRLLHGPDARMVCTVARSDAETPFGTRQDTLRIAGANRKPEEWFGIEIDLTPETIELAIALRVYPAIRLFPRVHFNLEKDVRHVDLPDVAASDSFATRFFPAHQWRAHPEWPSKATQPRMLLLVPSTPWFILELMEIERRLPDDA